MSNPDPYSTHLPVLAASLSLMHDFIPGYHNNLIEVGTGFYSTPLFLAAQSSRPGSIFLSFDSSEDWINTLTPLFTKETCCLLHLERPSLPVLTHYHLALIDCSPADWRLPILNQLSPITDLLILHDSNPAHDHLYHYSLRTHPFKHHLRYTALDPWTDILTDSDYFAERLQSLLPLTYVHS